MPATILTTFSPNIGLRGYTRNRVYIGLTASY